MKRLILGLAALFLTGAVASAQAVPGTVYDTSKGANSFNGLLRGRSGTTAVNHLSGAQVRSNGSANLQFNVKAYGATDNGTTDDDTAAINAAIAALNTAGKGVLYFPAGTYRVTAALTTITAPFTVAGDGHCNTNAGTCITKVVSTSATANLFTVTASRGLFRDIGIVNAAATKPTAGVGVTVTTPNLPGSPSTGACCNQVDFDHVYVGYFYDNIDVQSGADWNLTGSIVGHPVRENVRIRNLNMADAGDWSISDTVFEQATYQSNAAVRVESSGGGRITNVKVNGAGGAPGGLSFNNPIDARLTAPHSTSILLITNSSIENSRGDGIKVEGLHLVKIEGVQFGLYGNTTGELIELSNVREAVIDSIVAQNSAPAPLAFRLINCSRVEIGNYSLKDYSFATSFDGTYTTTGGTSKFMEVSTFALFVNSWANLGGAYETAGFGYWGGRVWLKGVLQSGNLNSVLWTLPVGFRPARKKLFRAHNGSGECFIEIDTTGTITQSSARGTNTALSLEHINFAP